MEAQVVFDRFEHTGIYIVDKETLITYYENPVAKKYSVKDRIGKPCYTIHGNSSMCKTCPIRNEKHETFVNRQDHGMVFVVRSVEIAWEGHPAYLVMVAKQEDTPIMNEEEKAMSRMSRALKRSVNVYTEINLDTMRYRQINLKNAKHYSVESEGEYAPAYEHMCECEIHPDDVQKVREIMAPEVLSAIGADSEGPSELSVRYRMKDPDSKVLMQSKAIFLRDEIPHYVVSIVTDVTEEAQIKEQKNSLESILNNVSVGVLTFEVVDSQMVILQANEEVGKIMEETQKEMIGPLSDKLKSLIHPDDYPLVKEKTKMLYQPNVKVDYEYRSLKRSTNEYIWLHIKGKSIAQPDGKVMAYVSYVDVTERKKLEQLKAFLEADKKASELKGDFLSNMSHEMRTPMNAIIGITNLAKDVVPENSEAAAYLGQINEASEYLLGIINDILTMSRIEEGKVEMNPEWIQQSDIFGPVYDMIHPMMEEKHITFHFNHDILKPRPVQVYLDAQKVKQMLMNILNNACKFTTEGGHIKLSFKNIAYDKEKHVAVDQMIVEDDGCGISKEFLPKVFLPFEQERTKETASIQGTGLGMAISQRIARTMGGDISVESELGKGTKFTITFTAKFRYMTEEKAQEADKKEHLEQHILSGKKVLLAEDHPVNAEIARKLLEKEGMIVTHASDGEATVRLFASNPIGTYDAILMDVRMPVMDGILATKAIRKLEREDAKTIPIIAMTANAFDEDRKETIQAGMNAHLSKPVNPKVLYETLETWIQGK